MYKNDKKMYISSKNVISHQKPVFGVAKLEKRRFDIIFPYALQISLCALCYGVGNLGDLRRDTERRKPNPGA